MKIRDRLTGELRNVKEGLIRIYTCGPTVYRKIHIGNLRSYIVMDVLCRLLKFLGRNILQVMNVTDIGDASPLSNADLECQRLKLSFSELTAFYTQDFVAQCQKLDVRLPRLIPVSLFLDEQKKLVQHYLNIGKAVQQDDGIVIQHNYENLNLFRKPEKPFYLWKKTQEYEGPGWHIECSYLHLRCFQKPLLNDNFLMDIHIGGCDLDIHHSNEMIQYDALFPNLQLSNIWLHIGSVNLNGKKMSKSTDNVLYLEHLDEKKLKFFYLLHNYNQCIEFSESKFKESENIFNKMFLFFKDQLSADELLNAKIVLSDFVQQVLNLLQQDIKTRETLLFIRSQMHFLSKADIISAYQILSQILNIPLLTLC